MSATATVERKRIAIGRYEAEEGPRELVALCRRDAHGDYAIDQLVDRPQGGSPGRVYVVESDVRPEDSVKALVRDYVAQAGELGHCPMSRAGIAALVDRGFLGAEA